MTLQKLRPSDIRTDGGTQMRVTISEPTVQQYASLMKDGVEFPPLVVFYDGAAYWLADGFHRLDAWLSLEKQTVECDVRAGSLRDAVLFSISANATHGLARKYGDKKRAVETLLRDEEWGKWSNACIASHVGVQLTYVHNLRRALVAAGEIQTRDVVTFKINGVTRERKSVDGIKRTVDVRTNYARDWLKLLVGFSAEQFLRWREQMSRREEVDRFAAAEAVECVVMDEATRAA